MWCSVGCDLVMFARQSNDCSNSEAILQRSFVGHKKALASVKILLHVRASECFECYVWILFQYTMLIGSPPFQGRSCHNDSANDIMSRIKTGEFRMDSVEWDDISSEAKRLIKGK